MVEQAELQQSATMRRSRETADLARTEKQVGISRGKDGMARQLFGTQPESRAAALLVAAKHRFFFRFVDLDQGSIGWACRRLWTQRTTCDARRCLSA